MHFLITRPEPDASEMRRMLEASGHSADVAPLLLIHINEPDAASIAEASALVVTSRNGLRSLERLRSLGSVLHLPLLVVGRGTGTAARALGFTDVTVGPATAKDLVPLIIKAWRDKISATAATPGPVLHLSGDKISFDLAPPLASAGIPFRRQTVYQSAPATRFPDAVMQRFETGGYDAIVLMSPLTAETFVHLVQVAGLAQKVRDAAYLCLSTGIAERLSPLGSEQLKVAAKPNIEEMVALIHHLAAQSASMSPPGDTSGNKV